MATADSVDESSVLGSDEISCKNHITSDVLTDPRCDLCFDVCAMGFCSQCCTFLCKECLDAHKRFPAMQNHRILQNGRMPKTQADRPVKYLDCDIHRANVKDHFCIDHSKMVCSQCIAEFDKTCKQKFISDLCTDIDAIDLQDLRDVTETIMKNINSIKTNMEQNKDVIKSQKNEMIEEANQLRDNLILKIENAHSSTISEINIIYGKKISHLSNQVSALSDMITSLDQTLNKIEKVIGIDITPHVFIQLQSLVENIRQSRRELAELAKQLCKVDLSFSTSPEISTFLSKNNTIGSVKEDLSQLGLMLPTPEIAFPSPSRKTNKLKTRAGRIARDIKQIKATKMTPLTVQISKTLVGRIIRDTKLFRSTSLDLNGMAVTSNNTLLLTDYKNKKVKAVSPDNKLLSSLTLSDKPYDITVIDGTTAPVITNEWQFHMLDISDPGSLAIQRSVSLGYSVISLAPCNNNLVVIKRSVPSCVKMITMTGAQLWSVSTEDNGQQLFKCPRSVTTNIINDKLTVMVTDWGKDTITLLDANNGAVIKIVDVKGKWPHGLTVDNDGNVYVCYNRSREICVWSGDFSQSRILLSAKDLQPEPVSIVHNDSTDEVFIAYDETHTVDHFKLS